MTHPRKVLYIAGAGRSGTSTLAGLASRIGLHVPRPEVAADETNPKGFAEPQWAVDFHNRVLRQESVQVSDSRPGAWELTAARCSHEPTVRQATTWLGPHFDEADELVVKDPRLSWFLPLWREASVRNDATPVFATMLRPPPEVVGSKQKYYANKLGSAHLAASWVNMLLHTEQATRDAARTFVRYADLLSDHRAEMIRVGEALSLGTVADATDEDWARLDGFIDPTLRRVGLDWADLGLPTRLEEITRESWERLNALVGDDSAENRAALDELREAYTQLYLESEAISKSSLVAAEVELKQAHRAELKKARESAGAGAAPSGSSNPGGPAAEVNWRAKVPAPVRRAVRRVVPRR